MLKSREREREIGQKKQLHSEIKLDDCSTNVAMVLKNQLTINNDH